MLAVTSSRRWLIVAVVMMAVLMAACQPAADSGAAASSAPTQNLGNGQRPNFQEQPASELPTDQPVLRGAVVGVNGSTLTVQEGGFAFGGGNFGGNGTPRPRPTPGPDVQVDASGATVYEDVTFANLNGQPPSGTIQQKVEASSLDKIPANARVTIWGTLNGTQATAKVIVFTLPRGGAPQG